LQPSQVGPIETRGFTLSQIAPAVAAHEKQKVGEAAAASGTVAADDKGERAAAVFGAVHHKPQADGSDTEAQALAHAERKMMLTVAAHEKQKAGEKAAASEAVGADDKVEETVAASGAVHHTPQAETKKQSLNTGACVQADGSDTDSNGSWTQVAT